MRLKLERRSSFNRLISTMHMAFQCNLIEFQTQRTFLRTKSKVGNKLPSSQIGTYTPNTCNGHKNVDIANVEYLVLA